MSSRSPWPWLVFLVWNTWFYAVSGRLAAEPWGAWFPDLGLVLLLGLEPRLSARNARLAAILAATARAAFTADPAMAVLAGYLGAVGLARALRGVVEADRALPCALFTGVAALFFGFFLSLVRSARLSYVAAAAGMELNADLAGLVWRGALATGLASFVLLPLLLRLPGLSSLRAPTRAGAPA